MNANSGGGARAELLTVQEVAALCRVSTDSVYRAIRRGELEAEEVFGCVRIRWSALREYRRQRRGKLKRQAAAGREGSLRALIDRDRRQAA